MSHSADSLSLYIAKHTRLVPKTEELSAANQDRARRTPILRQSIRIEHEKPFNFVSQSQSSITSPESSAYHNRVSRHPSRQPIRIECYVSRELSARVEVPSRLSARLGSLKPILIHRDLQPHQLYSLFYYLQYGGIIFEFFISMLHSILWFVPEFMYQKGLEFFVDKTEFQGYPQ